LVWCRQLLKESWAAAACGDDRGLHHREMNSKTDRRAIDQKDERSEYICLYLAY
jgi:hypothetical protein